jgi:hypothetical protein
MSITVKNSYESMIMNRILRKLSIPDLQEHDIINLDNIDCDYSKNIKDK